MIERIDKTLPIDPFRFGNFIRIQARLLIGESDKHRADLVLDYAVLLGTIAKVGQYERKIDCRKPEFETKPSRCRLLG